MLKVLLGVMNGDMIHDDTERDRCRVAQSSCRFRIPRTMPCYEVYLPVVLAKNLLATIHSKCGTFHADGPYDLLRLLRCDLRCSLSPSAPEGHSGTTGAYLWSQV